MWIDRRGRMSVSALGENAVQVRDRGRDGGRLTTVVQDQRPRGPGTVSEGPGGAIGVTASEIHDTPSYDPEIPPAASTAPFRFEGGAGGASAPATEGGGVASVSGRVRADGAPDGAGRPARARDAR